MYRILLVDDEINVLSALKRVLSGIPADDLDGERPVIETYSSTGDALNQIGSVAVDLVITDYRMPEMSGIDFLVRAIEVQPSIARIILSGYTDLDVLVDAINKVQISRFINKPWHDFELRSAVVQTLATRALSLDNQRLANLVQTKEASLIRHKAALSRLEAESPGITKIKRAEDGGILLDDDDT